MGAANYNTDLTDIDLCEDANSMQQIGSGNIQLGAGVDFRIQGTNAVDAKISGNITKGMMSNKVGTITNTADKHFFVWCQVATAGAMDIKSNGGKRIAIGSSTNNYMEFYVDGNDTNLEGGYKVYPIRYTTTADNPNGIYSNGSPGANPDHCGAVMKNTGVTVKSNNFSVDAIRHGDGVIYVDDGVAAAADFEATASYSDDNSRKWGLLVPIEGGVALRGKLNIGQNSSGTPTQAEFTDSNKLVAISDTEFTNSDFSQINIDHASTVASFTNITFLAIGTNNRGEFNGLNASSTVDFDTCAFNSVGVSNPEAGWTYTGCTWNGADQITQNGCTITLCSILASSNAVAMVVDDISKVTKNNFVGDSTGHAVDLGTIAASATLTWDNTFDTSTYATVDGSTGNEVILVNYTDTGADLTINVAAGASTPTVYNTGAGTVNVVAGQVTVDVNVKDSDGVTNLDDAGVYIYEDGNTSNVYINGHTNASGDISSSPFAYTTDINIKGWVRQLDLLGTDYVAKEVSGTITSIGATINVQLDPI